MLKKSLSLFFTSLFLVGTAPISLAVSDEQMSFIEEIGNKINVPKEYFLFNVKSKDGEPESEKVIECALVPLHETDDHRDCMKSMFGSKGDKEYMKYYLDGHLTGDANVDNRVKYSVSRMSEGDPKSLTFIMTYGDESVGRIAVGPITLGDSGRPEVGYSIKKEYSGKGITTASLKCILKIMQCMIDNNGSRYTFTKLRATAKPANKASNAILAGAGFEKSKDKINDGYGLENEYFYKFKSEKLSKKKNVKNVRKKKNSEK